MSNSQKQLKHPIEVWLTLNDPSAHASLKREAKVSNFLATTSEDSELAPSMSTLTGPGAASAKSNTDWETNPALGAANLAQIAMRAAGYDPTNLDMEDKANAANFNLFRKKLSECPLFITKYAEKQTLNESTSDWNDLIDSIADTFEGIMAEDKTAIVGSLKKLAKAASSKMSTKQTTQVFTQNTINVDDNLSYYLYSSQVSFEEEKGKGFHTRQSDFVVWKLRLEFQTELWPEWWERVKKTFDGDMDNWLDDTTTKNTGDEPIVWD
ncbi:hypothetical protein [uncultured Olleya sp.]|uniref:hypothetical protein n=1 Tax=uncultured Olleya sp. TaxID=757243 RepID=UPI0025914168|nr:hypothetical protein [uncultured Olleya sp.]